MAVTGASDDRASTRIATLSALLVVATFVAGKAARDAVLLAQFSIRSLPLFIGISAALSLPIIIVAGKLMVKHGPRRLVPAMHATSGVLSLVEFVLISSYPRPIAVAVFLHLTIMGAVLVSGFWSIVNERFDIVTAKQRIGRIGMGATVGGILGGLIAERTAVYLEPNIILVVLGTLQLACAVILYAFGSGVRHVRTQEQQPGTLAALGTVMKSSLLRKVVSIVVLTAISAGALDYVFKADIIHGGSRDDLLRTLAVFYTATSVITAIVQVALCGPIMTWFGVPRSVGTLPFAITGFGLLSLLVPIPTTATIARGAELVTRNSLYRAGYELLYAPLPPEQKRPTKVVIDVGADKIGDILAAQLVGAIVFAVSDVRAALLIASVAIGGLCVLITLRLPRSYTEALEASLLEVASELPPEPPAAEPWLSLTSLPSFGHPGEVVPLQLRRRARAASIAQVPTKNPTDRLLGLVRELRSDDPNRVRRALANPLPVEVALVAIELLDQRDELARPAITALVAAAPRCTGLLVDVMLDQRRPEATRRRLPAIIARGEPRLAAWGLWCGLADPSFDVRCHCSAMLTPLALDGHLAHVRPEDVFEHVRRELVVEREVWVARKPMVDSVLDRHDDEALEADIGLAHVFRMLGLVLPAEPLRIALRAVQTDEPALRGMALEYLESILPADVRAQLWPLLDVSTTPALPVTEAAPHDNDLMTRLGMDYEALLEKLKPHRHGSH